MGLTFAAKHVGKAIEAYRKASVLNPNAPAVQACMGGASMRQQDFRGAISEGFETNPDIQYIRAQLVRAWVVIGDLDAARNEAGGENGCMKKI